MLFFFAPLFFKKNDPSLPPSPNGFLRRSHLLGRLWTPPLLRGAFPAAAHTAPSAPSGRGLVGALRAAAAVAELRLLRLPAAVGEIRRLPPVAAAAEGGPHAALPGGALLVAGPFRGVRTLLSAGGASHDTPHPQQRMGNHRVVRLPFDPHGTFPLEADYCFSSIPSRGVPGVSPCLHSWCSRDQSKSTRGQLVVHTVRSRIPESNWLRLRTSLLAGSIFP